MLLTRRQALPVENWLSNYHKVIPLTTQIDGRLPPIKNAALVSPLPSTGASALSSCSSYGSERNWYVLLPYAPASLSHCSLVAPSQFPLVPFGAMTSKFADNLLFDRTYDLRWSSSEFFDSGANAGSATASVDGQRSGQASQS